MSPEHDSMKHHLGIEKNRAHDLRIIHGGSQVFESFLVVFMAPMGKVEASNVHTGFQQLLQNRNITRLWTKSADDFCLRNLMNSATKYSIDVKLSTSHNE